MKRMIVLAGAVLAFSLASSPAQAQGPKHPGLHVAVFELQEAHAEIKAAPHDFRGNRLKSLLAVDAAVHQIKQGLKAAGEPYTGVKVDPEHYKLYGFLPHVHHALAVLKDARNELASANHNFGGHRDHAIRDINYAVNHLERIIQYGRR